MRKHQKFAALALGLIAGIFGMVGLASADSVVIAGATWQTGKKVFARSRLGRAETYDEAKANAIRECEQATEGNGTCEVIQGASDGGCMYVAQGCNDDKCDFFTAAKSAADARQNAINSGMINV